MGMETIKIQGMSCQHCVMAVTKALGKLAGVKNVKVDLAKQEATYENSQNISPEQIRKAVEEAGYKVGAWKKKQAVARRISWGFPPRAGMASGAFFDIAYHPDDRPTQVRTISKRQGIAPRYREQIFQKLKRAGIVNGIRGPKGGYSLNRKPEKITVGDIIRAVGESVQPVFCGWSPKAGRRCRRESHCVANLVWKKMGIESRTTWIQSPLRRCAAWAGRSVWKERKPLAKEVQKPKGDNFFLTGIIKID
jgi:Rrf2 family transcriptional regulator, cysteine metabolism repressor